MGKCYHCSLSFVPLHVYPKATLNALTAGEGAEENDTSSVLPWGDIPISEYEEEHPTLEEGELHEVQLSHLSSGGFDGPRTIKLVGHVADYKVLTMIDNGASHCFISERVAKQLNRPVDTTCQSAVTLGMAND